MDPKVLTIILAGGEGKRLRPLTFDRAKPAVPFAGAYRIIDFTLSNCINSDLFKILVLTQYKSLSLDRHVGHAWGPLFRYELGHALDIVPPQHRIRDDLDWYRGTADAVYQNIYSIEREHPDYVLVLAGDHVYTMDYRTMLRFHCERNADVTIGAVRVTVAEAALQFGVLQVDGEQRVIGFQEKPAHPTPLPGDPEHTLASMGIYVFSRQFLVDVLQENAARPDSGHDFGQNILPAVHQRSRVFAFSCRAPDGTAAYWRDVGTLDTYFAANRDFLRADAPLKLHCPQWPIRTHKPNLPPPLLLSSHGDQHGARCVTNSIIGTGTVIQDARVARSVIGADCRIAPDADLEDCIVFDNVHIGASAVLRRTIVEKAVHLAAGTRIGFDHDADQKRGFTLSPAEVTVVPRGYVAVS